MSGGGSLFHARGPATANDRSPNDDIVGGTATALDAADLRPALPVAAADVVIGSLERSRVRVPADALSGNDLGQVVHTNVPLFTKQYNLVLCEGFMKTRQYVAAMHGSNEQGEYCRSGSAVISRLLRTAI